MNVFVIPSWYPNQQYPLAGSFVAEQVKCLAELSPDNNFTVSVAGAGEYHLPLQRLRDMFRVFGRFINAKPETREVLPNLSEYHYPVLHWTPKLGSNLQAITAAHEKHLQEVISRHGKVTCIHAHVTYPAGWVAMTLSEKYDIPYIITEHTGPFPVEISRFIRNGRLTRWLREPIEKAAEVIAVSPALADRMLSFGLTKPAVIPNFVDERKFSPTPLPADKVFTFLTVAAMIESKGIADLLKAIAMLARQGVKVRHIIVGNGSDLEQFKTMAGQMAIKERIQWYGHAERETVASLFGQCHAFVLPSHGETFGIVYAEAIASGRPVLATRCGGPESIVNEINGVLVDVGDITALAKAMSRMIENISEYSPQQIHSDFMQRFSRKVVVEQLLRVYSSSSNESIK